jgi:positive regulator of sigma E activity
LESIKEIIHHKGVFIIGIILALPTLIYYLYEKYKKNTGKKADLKECIVVIVGCIGTPAGLKIMAYSIIADNLNELDSDRVVIFIGGFALCWLAVEGIYRVFKP